MSPQAPEDIRAALLAAKAPAAAVILLRATLAQMRAALPEAAR